MLHTTKKFVIIIIKAAHYLMVGDQTKLETASAMMKPTMQTATMMEVTVVERVPTQTIVQIVSVMQSLQSIPIVSKHTVDVYRYSVGTL